MKVGIQVYHYALKTGTQVKTVCAKNFLPPYTKEAQPLISGVQKLTSVDTANEVLVELRSEDSEEEKKGLVPRIHRNTKF